MTFARHFLVATLVAVFLGLALGCRSTSSANKKGSSRSPLPLAAETFDAVWNILNDYHFDTTFAGLDWNKVRDQYRPRALNAPTSAQFHKVIQEMLDLLQVSHLAIVPGELAEMIEEGDEATPEGDEHGPGNPGLSIRIWNNSAVVTKVRPGSPAEASGVRPGYIIRKINKVELTPKLKKLQKNVTPNQYGFLGWKMVNGLLSGAPGSKVKVELLDENSRLGTLQLERALLPGTPVQMGSLPELYANLTTEELQPDPHTRIGIIQFNIWMLPTALAFEKAVDQFRHHDGLIIDLRGNIGGVAGMVMGVAGHFLDKPVSLGTMRMRDNQMSFPVNPRRVSPTGQRVEPFSGPLALITDEISVSASELFAGALQELGRARVFGRPTTGQALPAIHDRLPNGDVLYHPFGDFITAGGTRIEGRGVIPDVLVPLDRKALLAGRDLEVERAVQWILEQQKTKTAP